jgi:uncharacterized BrkB/YihY/UPF0761 family membrane protein
MSATAIKSSGFRCCGIVGSVIMMLVFLSPSGMVFFLGAVINAVLAEGGQATGSRSLK